MEDISTSLEKMLAKFNDSITHSAPKKLSFKHLNESFNDSDTVAKKSRMSENISEDIDNSGHNDTVNTNSNCEDKNKSLNSNFSIPPSPWETRRMKADLIEAKSRISKLKQEMGRYQKLHKESETLLENQVTELKKQCSYSNNKVLDLEKHMQLLRKREYATKQENVKIENEFQQEKLQFQDEIRKLQKDKQDVEVNARAIQNSMANELGECKRHSEKIELELELCTDELDNLKQQLMDYKTKASAYDELKLQNESICHKLDNANSRIKELEFEIASYKDWGEVMKNSQIRLLNMPEMDKELERLRANNKHLQDLLGNKLLLEEQVHDMQTRLVKAEQLQTNYVAVQVQLENAQAELKEWIKVAEDHCPANTIISPLYLRARIEDLLRQDIILASEKSSRKSETKSLESELFEYKQKCEIYSKNLDEFNVALKRHKTFKDRVQKKLLLVSKERDCYKQLLENFEKDLTMSCSNIGDLSSIENQLRNRIDILENTLDGYKEMCSSLEKELNNFKTMGKPEQISLENSMDLNIESSSVHEHFKKELDTLRLENERMRRRKEELELQLEQHCLKNAFGLNEQKIVHKTSNPSIEAYQNADDIVSKLKAEVERLKRRNKKLEEGKEQTTTRLNETISMTLNIKDMNQLKTEVDMLNAKIKKMKECYKSASMEFRDVVYMLLGYRIDRVGPNSNYKIISMYADKEVEYLNFRLNESNVLDMLETPYSITLQPLIDTLLAGNKSLPAFLSTLTLDLFQRATMTVS